MVKKVHDSLTPERVLEAAEECTFGLANTGFCLACGAEVEGVEPDAHGYTCEDCGETEVYGAPEIILMGGPRL
jgi:predicted RNA-binding Zn-ribbon protein involved in translation (DUF1610 family)